jgi:hypothetical protein
MRYVHEVARSDAKLASFSVYIYIVLFFYTKHYTDNRHVSVEVKKKKHM